LAKAGGSEIFYLSNDGRASAQGIREMFDDLGDYVSANVT